MPKKNARNMNDVFGRRALTTSEPDAFWPLQNELVGIEIEVEDLEGDVTRVMPDWTIHQDMSLRNGTEFVTSGPLGGKRLTRAINKFFDAAYQYNMSPRTSVHVHINASDNMSVDQFRNLFTIMYLIEPAVFRWADENRKWCGYCSPLTDLDPVRIISILNENQDDRGFIAAIKGTGNSDRYYGLNVSAYVRHGTMEFRYFPCTNNREDIVAWTKFVMYVKKTAMEFDSPGDLLDAVNTRAKMQEFIASKFGEVAGNISANLDFDDSVARVHELRGMLGVTPTQVKAGESYRSQRSKGFTKFLAHTFPAKAAENPAERYEVAANRFAKASTEYHRIITGKSTQAAALAALTEYRAAERAYRDAQRLVINNR